jgi:hypothetical protein
VKSSRKRVSETIVKSLPLEKERGVIPTTFVPLAPDKIVLVEDRLDVLFGLFFIMWRDMPRPMAFRIRLSDQVTANGAYAGCYLKFGFPRAKTVKC